MRFALGVDDDLADFYEELAHDPTVGRSVRSRPWLRVRRRPEPFEALAWAICEQLIEFERAAAIQRRIVGVFGPRGRSWEGRRAPCATCPRRRRSPARRRRDLSRLTSPKHAPACSCGVARGGEREGGPTRRRPRARWARLRAIPGIGPWTVEMLALCGQGRHDQLPGRGPRFAQVCRAAAQWGRSAGRATKRMFVRVFAPYGRWAAWRQCSRCERRGTSQRGTGCVCVQLQCK